MCIHSRCCIKPITMSNLTKFLALASIALTMACANESKPNEILQHNAPDSRVYKNELGDLLEKTDSSKLYFYFEKYVQKDSIDYLYINIEGDLKATAVVTVKHWDEKLQPLYKSGGMGYRGSEFKNLKLEIERSTADTYFIYKGMDKISD